MDQKEKKIEQFKGQTRLPKFAVPKRYDLTLKPDLVDCTFSGSVQIEVTIIEETSVLVLNVLELSIHESMFTDSYGKQCRPSDVVVDVDDEILVLVFDDVLSVGNGVLEFKFSGVLNDYMKGFYRGILIDIVLCVHYRFFGSNNCKIMYSSTVLRWKGSRSR